MWWVFGKNNKSFALRIQWDSLDSNHFQLLMGHIRTKLGLSHREQSSQYRQALESKHQCSAVVLPVFTQPSDGRITEAQGTGPNLALPFPQLLESLPPFCHLPSSPSRRSSWWRTFRLFSHSRALRSFSRCFIPGPLDPTSSMVISTPLFQSPPPLLQ